MTDTERTEKALGLAKSAALTLATLIDAARTALDNDRPGEARRYASFAADIADIVRTDAQAAVNILL